MLAAQRLEPASDSVSPSLSAPPLLTLCLFVSLKKKSTFNKIKLKKERNAKVPLQPILCPILSSGFEVLPEDYLGKQRLMVQSIKSVDCIS